MKHEVLIFCHYADFNPDGSSRLLSPVEKQLLSQNISYRKYVLPSRAKRNATLGLSGLGLATFLWTVLWRFSTRWTTGWSSLRKYFTNRIENNIFDLLEKESPKLIVMTGEFLPLNLAASAADTELVEILHGREYESIPWGYDTRSRKELPGHLICFDQRSIETFEPLSQLGIELHHASSQLPFNLERSEDSIDGEEEMVNILIPGQWGSGFIGPIDDSNELLRSFVLRLRRHSRRMRITFIPHPVQLATRKYSKAVQFVSVLAEGEHRVQPSYALGISMTQRYICLGYDSGLMTDFADIGIPRRNIEQFWDEIRNVRDEDLYPLIWSISAKPAIRNDFRMGSVSIILDLLSKHNWRNIQGEI